MKKQMRVTAVALGIAVMGAGVVMPVAPVQAEASLSIGIPKYGKMVKATKDHVGKVLFYDPIQKKSKVISTFKMRKGDTYHIRQDAKVQVVNGVPHVEVTHTKTKKKLYLSYQDVKDDVVKKPFKPVKRVK